MVAIMGLTFFIRMKMKKKLKKFAKIIKVMIMRQI